MDEGFLAISVSILIAALGRVQHCDAQPQRERAGGAPYDSQPNVLVLTIPQLIYRDQAFVLSV
jgi:hypothetical protein